MPPASAPAPARGSVQLVGGKARLVESASYVGQDGFGFTLVANGRLLVPARAIVTVQGVVLAGGGEGLAPAFPTTGGVIGPVAIGTLQATYDALTPAQVAAGVTVLVTPGGTLSGNLTLGKSGAAAAPIIVRVGTLSGGQFVDPTSFPAGTFAGYVDFTGDHNWVRGLSFGAGGRVRAGATGNRLNRCYVTGAFNGTDHGPGNGNCLVDYGPSSIFDWCEIDNFVHVGLQHWPSQGSLGGFAYRTWIHDQTDASGNSGTLHMLGSGLEDDVITTTNPRTHVHSGIIAREMLYGPPGTAGESWECKTSYASQIRCVAQGAMKSNIRHGAFNTVIACRQLNGFIGGRGSDNALVDIAASQFVGPFTGDIDYDTWAATATKTNAIKPLYPSGMRFTVVRCGGVSIGDTSGSHHGGYPRHRAGPDRGVELDRSITNQNSPTRTSLHPGVDPAAWPPGQYAMPPTWRSAAGAGGPAQVGPNGVYNAAD